MGYYVKIYPENPQEKQMENVAKTIRDGGIVVIPTDTVYALACDSSNSSAMKKMARLKGANTDNAMFSFLFNDLSHLAEYTKPIDSRTYKLLKRALPGSYTFIMEASTQLMRIFKKKKKTVGIRVPDNNIARSLTEMVGAPLAVTSLHIDDEIMEYPSNAELIYEDYKNQVDVVVDGGIGGLMGSTIIDVTQDPPEIVREGAGDLNIL